ncbi:MAG: glycosyltransferase [bacterium]
MSPAFREENTPSLGELLKPSRLAASARYRSRLVRQWLVRGFLSRTLGASRKLWGDNKGPSPLLRRNLWAANRTYKPMATATALNLTKDFKDILSRTAGGRLATQEELLPYLTLGSVDERAQVNAMLADAYTHQPTAERLAQAKVFIQRAWLLSRFSIDILPLYVRIVAATGDTAALRDAFKRGGINAARQGQASEALALFDRWHYAYHDFDHADRYEYDFDIMNSVDDLAAPYRYVHDSAPALAPDEKIRLACLVQGMTQVNSNLIKIDLELAKYRDRSRFDLTFFVLESEDEVLSSPQGREYLDAFEKLGCHVVTAPKANDVEKMLLGLARRINESRPHILLTSAALATFRQYYITSLRPAPIQVGLIQGPPAQFAAPTLDSCIGWTRHPLLDCPLDSTWVRIYLDSPARDEINFYDRTEMDLPESACVLLSGGRPAKFQDLQFWKVIVDLMAENPDAFFLAVGPQEDQIPFLDEVVPQELKPRIRCLGWREDFLEILGTADIVIDTYPNGGGLVVVQAMSMGIPVAAQRNDYMRPFTQTDWSPVEDFLDQPDLLATRGDFERFKQVISKLIQDPGYRRESGERCREQHLGQANPAATVRRCEEIYTQLVERYSSST